jgi:hypothetical protein
MMLCETIPFFDFRFQHPEDLAGVTRKENHASQSCRHLGFKTHRLRMNIIYVSDDPLGMLATGSKGPEGKFTVLILFHPTPVLLKLLA